MWKMLLIAGGLGLLAGCSLVEPDQSVRVLLPAPPAGWQIAFPGLTFHLTSWSSSGAVTEAVALDWRQPAQLACARSTNVPVLAWPCVLSPGGAKAIPAGVLRPAGGLFPADLRSWHGQPVIELTWEDGAAALVLDRARSAGADLARFNAPRLVSCMRARADPWTLELDRAAQCISLGTFTSWDLDERPSQDVEVDAGPGSWFLEDPLAPPAQAEGTRVVLKRITRGTHCLFSLGGARWCVQVEEQQQLLLAGP